MSLQDIAFYLGETWSISGVANDADGQPIPLADVEFRISGPDGPVLSMNKAAGVELLNATGEYAIKVQPASQDGFDATTPYRYEVKAISTAGDVSIQNAGRFILMRSL